MADLAHTRRVTTVGHGFLDHPQDRPLAWCEAGVVWLTVWKFGDVAGHVCLLRPVVGCPLRAGVDVRPPRDAARVFEKYALRDTKSNTCSINDGCVGQTMVKNEHVFDRTHVRTPDPGPGHGNNRGNTQGMKGSAMTSPTSSTFRSSPTHTALKTREPR